MRRLKLVSLALASTLLLTLAGCATTNCDDNRFFPRLFNRSNSSPGFFSRGGMHGGGECECQQPGFPYGATVPAGQGPFLVPPNTSASNPTPPIPITNTHGQPPFLKVPNAPPTAYVPAGH